MKRRDFFAASVGIAGGLIPHVGRAAIPCPPPLVGVNSGTSASTTCPSGSVGGSYSTNFAAIENPLSEGGRWVHPAAAVWNTTVRTVGGAGAFGDPASSAFNDTVAVLVGNYGAHQTATGVVYHPAGSGSAELELHLRLSYNATQIFTYEIDFVVPTLSVAIVKWRGNQGNFINLPLVNGTSGTYAALKDGDVVVAEISGDASTAVITVKLNGILIAQAIDSVAVSGSAPYASGNPGIGFDVGAGGNSANLGWKRFSVVSA
jgi:hypothetical protein